VSIRFIEAHSIEHRTGKPYTPATQGKVERANRTLKEIIKKLVQESKHTKTWFDVLYEATLCMNTNYSNVIRKSPYKHVFLSDPVNAGDLARYATQVQLLLNKISDNYAIEAKEDDDEPASPIMFDVVESAEIREIREDTHVSYYKNMDMMKSKHDRLRKTIEYNIGDAVGILIPNNYVSSIAKIVPAIIIDKRIRDNEISYKLAYRTYIVDAIYYTHELIKFVGDVHYTNMGINVNKINEFVSNMNLKFFNGTATKFALKTIYDMYLLEISDNRDYIPITIPQNESHIEEQLAHEETEADTSSEKENIVSNIETNLNVEIHNILLCGICTIPIQNVSTSMSCGKCNTPLHTKNECKYGIVQYVHKAQTYCSIACFTQQKCYEVSIIDENVKRKQYLMRLNTGENVWNSKNIVEKLAQYYKMICEWRESHPIMEEEDIDPDEVMIISTTNNDDKCCVCNEILTIQNWHKCHVCKRRMHGKIICERGIEIYQDDDKLFCSEKCKSKY
jgi:hypothetical protein